MKKKQNKLTKNIGDFFKAYQRKAQRGVEPNDRHYDRKVEKKVKALPPEELSNLMHDDVGVEVPKEIDDKWFSSELIDGVSFKLNDSVSVIAGPHAGKSGAVISLNRLIPEPEYLVELGSGSGDIKAFQSNLRKLDDESMKK